MAYSSLTTSLNDLGNSSSLNEPLVWEPGVGVNQSDFQNNTVTEAERSYIPYDDRPETYIVPAVFFVIFVVGIVGNGTLVFIFLRHRSMRSIPNTYIMSLAIGDFLVIAGTVPFISTIYTFDSWPYGVFICKLSEFLRDVSSGVTVLTLTLLSVDRYIAIVKPLHKLTGRSGRTYTMILAVVVWVVATGVALPGAIYSFLWIVPLSSNHVIYVCYPFPEDMFPWYPQTMVLIKFILLYAVPLAVISAFYVLMARHLLTTSKATLGSNDTHKKKLRARTKVAKVVLAFVIIFAVCFFPSHVFLMWFYFHSNAREHYTRFWHAWKILGYVLTFVNSCLNPVALYFISGVFRNQYRKYLLCCCCKVKPDRADTISFRTLGSNSMKSTLRSTIVSRI